MRATNVRSANKDAVYLTGDVTGTDINTDIASWINATYFTANTPDIKALSFTNSKGKFDFTRLVTDTVTLTVVAK